MRRLIVAATFLLISASCFADVDEEVVRTMAKQTRFSEKQIREHYNSCDDGRSLIMQICGAYLFTKEDIHLNKIYKQLRPIAKENGYEALLVRSQKSWLSYRDAACDFEGSMGAGGGMDQALYNYNCKTMLSKERADHLAKWIQAEEQKKEKGN